MYFWICGSFKSAKNNFVANRRSTNHKKIDGLQIVDPQIATSAEGPQILKK